MNASIPVDDELPALRFVREHGFDSLLQSVGVADLTHVELLKHHRASRCTWAVTAGGRALIVKAYAPGVRPRDQAGPHELFDLLDALDHGGWATGTAPTVPPIIAIDRERCWYVMATIEAPTARRLLRHRDGERAGALAAEWLTATADVGIALGPDLSPATFIPLVESWAAAAGEVPEFAMAASVCAEALVGTVPSGRATLRHGRFSPYHLYDLGSGPAVVDWDTFGQAPMELDAAGFLARLARVTRASESASIAAGRLRRDIEPVVDDVVPAWYEAALLLRGAVQLVRRQTDRWPERGVALLTEARNRVGS